MSSCLFILHQSTSMSSPGWGGLGKSIITGVRREKEWIVASRAFSVGSDLLCHPAQPLISGSLCSVPARALWRWWVNRHHLVLSVLPFVALTFEHSLFLFYSSCLEVIGSLKKTPFHKLEADTTAFIWTEKCKINEWLVDRKWFVAKSIILCPKESRESKCNWVASPSGRRGSDIRLVEVRAGLSLSKPNKPRLSSIHYLPVK